MRRTDEEFKAEVLRRSKVYQARRKKRRTMIAAFCLPLLLCGGALMAVVSAGYGGAAEKMADNAYSMMEVAPMQEAPAAAAPEMPKAESAEEGIVSDSFTVSRFVEIISQPESEEYARIFTNPEKIDAILDAINAFYEAPDTVSGGGEVEACEGMRYRIIVTEGEETREYTLYNNAIASDSEAGWFVNPGCYRALELLITQPSD